MREIVLDTETTGLSVENGDRIIEIGCVEIFNRSRTGKFYHIYLNTDKEISAGAQQIHGITKEFLQDKPKFPDIAQEFLDFIADSPLVIHNAKFDTKFINNELILNNFTKLSNQIVDSLVLAKQKFPGAKVNLDALCKKFNIDASKRDKHGALLDSELLADVYLELTGGSQISLSFSQTKQINQENNLVKIDFPYRKFAVPEQELKDHKELVKNISNSLWKY